MNPRIKELHLKAGFWASEQLPFTNPEWVELRDEKFAELIVRECAAIADDKAPKDPWAVGVKIKQHFGVEL